MMNSDRMFICGCLAASVVSFAAYADDAPAPANNDCGNSCLFKLENFGFSETIKAYNFDGDNSITEFNSTLTFTPSKEWNAHVSLPVINQDSVSTGMLEVGADFLVASNLCKFVDSFSIGLDLELPTANADFGGNSVNTIVSADLDGKVGIADLKWGAGVSNQWTTDATYAPLFGGLVEGDIFNANAMLGHSFADGKFCVGANYNYWNLDGTGEIHTIGPSFVVHFSSNFDMEFGWDIPFSEFEGSQVDDVFTVGASLKF